jgi:hypothetical protein
MKRYNLSGGYGGVVYSVSGDDLDMLKLEAARRLQDGYTARIFDRKEGKEYIYTLEMLKDDKPKTK